MDPLTPDMLDISRELYVLPGVEFRRPAGPVREMAEGVRGFAWSSGSRARRTWRRYALWPILPGVKPCHITAKRL
ncbi:hypothetical protein GCM10009864_06110 [Streptomyces lunalinharesii]|uniref:Uncharacterized protein n=1 Tax=Streptomyces lunalinharesii TaxID=333384 RepID=A0ABP6DMP0_9ACTN